MIFDKEIAESIIIHIPHSGIELNYKDFGYNALSDLLISTDWHTDKIFYSHNHTTLINPVSRLFCDVERFIENEPMSKFGRGMYYEKDVNGFTLRDRSKYEIVKKYYEAYHSNLTKIVESKLEKYNTALIIDCHSFNSMPLPYEDKSLLRPDICIGTDEYHTDKFITEYISTFLTNKKVDFAFNTPYSGSIVPLKYYRTDKRVHSVMIEVNKKLYMNEKTYEFYPYIIQSLNDLFIELISNMR